MRFYSLYVCGLSCLLSLPVAAAGLPANPWIRTAVENMPISAETTPQTTETSAPEIKPEVKERFQDAQNQLIQVINEALPEQERQPSALLQKSLPNWKDLMSQVNFDSLTTSKSSKPARSKPKKKASSSAGSQEISRAMSDIEAQYNSIKRTSNAYYNQAKRNVKMLEREAENSIDQLKRMVK